MSTLITTKKLLALVAATACLLAATTVPLTVRAEDKLPAVDSDGLHLIKDSKVRVAYARPGASLARYNRLIILDCFVAFEEDWMRSYNLDQVGLSGRVDDKDMEKIKKDLAAEFKEVFTKELQDEGGYEIVDITGPDVLILRPAIVNLDPTAPDVGTSSAFHHTIVNSAGSMTLYMEFYDSTTSELLARAIDPRSDRFGGEADRMGNKAAADRILRHWAKLLRDYLDEVKNK
jgi:hypothetical protein